MRPSRSYWTLLSIFPLSPSRRHMSSLEPRLPCFPPLIVCLTLRLPHPPGGPPSSSALRSVSSGVVGGLQREKKSWSFSHCFLSSSASSSILLPRPRSVPCSSDESTHHPFFRLMLHSNKCDGKSLLLPPLSLRPRLLRPRTSPDGRWLVSRRRLRS